MVGINVAVFGVTVNIQLWGCSLKQCIGFHFRFHSVGVSNKASCGGFHFHLCDFFLVILDGAKYAGSYFFVFETL